MSQQNINNTRVLSSRRLIDVYDNYLRHCNETRSMCMNMLSLLTEQEHNMRLALSGAVEPRIIPNLLENANNNIYRNINPHQLYSNTFLTNASPNTNTNTNNNIRNINRSNNRNSLSNIDLTNLFETIGQEIQRIYIEESATRNNNRRIPPTNEQIQNATTETNFGNLINPINTTCPISGETFEDNTNVLRINHCGHIFEKEPLLIWFRTNSRCPLCRYSIIPQNNNSNNINSNNQTGNGNENNEEVPDIQIESIIIEPIYANQLSSNDNNSNRRRTSPLSQRTQLSTNTNRNVNANTNINANSTTYVNTNTNNTTPANTSLLYQTLFPTTTNMSATDLLRNILSSPSLTSTSYDFQPYQLRNNPDTNTFTFTIPNTLNFDISSNQLD